MALPFIVWLQNSHLNDISESSQILSEEAFMKPSVTKKDHLKKNRISVYRYNN